MPNQFSIREETDIGYIDRTVALNYRFVNINNVIKKTRLNHKYFEYLGANLNDKMPYLSFKINHITLNNLVQIIRCLDINKTIGNGGMGQKMLKLCNEVIAPFYFIS